MFCTVLRSLKSPANVGTIVRAHVAFGGSELVFVGSDLPWRFRKRSQAFSRKLERLCEIHVLNDDDSFFRWCDERDHSAVGVEITEPATPVYQYVF